MAGITTPSYPPSCTQPVFYMNLEEWGWGGVSMFCLAQRWMEVSFSGPQVSCSPGLEVLAPSSLFDRVSSLYHGNDKLENMGEGSPTPISRGETDGCITF